MTTIDLDNDEICVHDVENEISMCPYLVEMKVKPSSSRGFHISLLCRLPCLVCRLLFDDPVRLEADLKNRMTYQRDVLFDRKVKVSLKEFLKLGRKVFER
jgi:hypothetical protein